MKEDLTEILEKIEFLDREVSRLLENQERFPTSEGDKLISSLLHQIVILEKKLKSSSKQPASIL